MQHRFEDKFLLAEQLSNTALASIFTSLTHIGLTVEHLLTLREWAQTSAVSMRFQVTRRCQFNRKAERLEEEKTKHVTEVRRNHSTC